MVSSAPKKTIPAIAATLANVGLELRRLGDPEAKRVADQLRPFVGRISSLKSAMEAVSDQK